MFLFLHLFRTIRGNNLILGLIFHLSLLLNITRIFIAKFKRDVL